MGKKEVEKRCTPTPPPKNTLFGGKISTANNNKMTGIMMLTRYSEETPIISTVNSNPSKTRLFDKSKQFLGVF